MSSVKVENGVVGMGMHEVKDPIETGRLLHRPEETASDISLSAAGGLATATTEEVAGDLAPISVRFDSIRWEVDFGRGITQRFADRDEAITSARRAAASDNREVQIDA